MRHGNKVNNLSRPKAARDSMILSQVKSLLQNKILETTTAKAKVAKQFTDRFLNNLLRKEGLLLERYIEKSLKTKDLNKYLIEELKPLLDSTKTGGFTKIYKVESRKGDNATMSLLKLTLVAKAKSTKSKKKSK